MDMAKEYIGGNDALVVARDAMGRPQLFREGEEELDLDEALPFRDYPGVPAARDDIADRAILERLRRMGNGRLPKKGAVLDYGQSAALFQVANRYHTEDSPLMRTERWLARFVEDNDITYTDHDGRRYKMRNGLRYPVSGRPSRPPVEIVDEDDFDASDEDDEDALLLV